MSSEQRIWLGDYSWKIISIKSFSVFHIKYKVKQRRNTTMWAPYLNFEKDPGFHF